LIPGQQEVKNAKFEFVFLIIVFDLVTSASDFQRLHNAISTNLTKISNNATDLEKLVQKLGTPEDSEPLRER
jgi:hypothetical protein